MNSTASLIASRLQPLYSRQEALALTRLICCELLGQRTVDYYVGKDIILSAKQEEELESILERLLHFEPIQYIVGEGRFLGRNFKVGPGVLIPRPETEELVEEILKAPVSSPRVLDIGTGSGCIAISIAKEWPDAEVFAWDISEKALLLAQENNDLLEAKVTFEQHDVLQYQPEERACYDIIVSNPPYIMEKERLEMERNVLDWEPETALFVPDTDPLLFYRRIGELGIDMLVPGGRLYFEINRVMGTQTVEMLVKQGYTQVVVKKDISGNDRMVIAVR